jgi:hypothetical protein
VAAWVILGVVVTTVTASLAAAAAFGEMSLATFGLGMLPFPLVGAVVAARRPANPVGWIMLTIGVLTAFDGALGVYGVAGLRGTVSLPAPAAVLTVRVSLWVPIFGLMGTFLLLLVPDGHLPSPRWRGLAWLSAATMAACWTMIVFTPGTFADVGFPSVDNPFALSALGDVTPAVLPWLLALLPVCIVGSALSLALRYRGAHGVQRLQLKWLAAAACAAAALYLVTMLPGTPFVFPTTEPAWADVLDIWGPLGFLLIPLAIGVAMLRHRLYDIDVIINRALVYGVLTSALTLAYAALVTVLQQLLRPLSGGSDLAVAASTLLVAAAFQPARRRIQALIDRVFYRRRFDAARTLETFGQRLRHDHDLPSLHDEITSSVRLVMQPSHVSLWVPGGRAGER